MFYNLKVYNSICILFVKIFEKIIFDNNNKIYNI